MIQRKYKRSRELITLADWRKAKYAILYYRYMDYFYPNRIYKIRKQNHTHIITYLRKIKYNMFDYFSAKWSRTFRKADDASSGVTEM